MVQIQNTDAVNAVRNGAKLSISEGFPTNLLPNVQAVLDMTPRFHRVAKVLGGGTGTLLTASTTRDTYITGIMMSYTKVAADTGTYMRITWVQDGQTIVGTYLDTTTLVADTEHIYIPFVTPIKVDRGSSVAVAIAGTFTSRYAIVYGYEVEQPQ